MVYVARVIAKLEPGGAQLSMLRVLRELRGHGIDSTLSCGWATPAGIELARRHGVEPDARFAEDRDYDQIAADTGTSQASVRQRVSRGLSALRGPLRVYRAAQELARQDRAFRFAGGHGGDLADIGPRDPLDCSSSTSLLLLHAGVFAPGAAWTSGRLAAEWGDPGEGRYITLWADDEHVWMEFRLDADHGERFDPTPSRLAPHSRWLTSKPARDGDCVPRHWPGL